MSPRPAVLTPRLANHLALMVLDVDGVLTDGGLYFGARGEALKRFHVRDGHGIKQMQKIGIEVAVISGRRSSAVQSRCRELGIKHVFQGAADKNRVFERLLKKLKLSADQVICMGDDTPDIPLFVRVGFAVAVQDAHALAIAAADRTTALAGGKGAVREVCDWILRARANA
jgi:3-deoxy-D-manno-octulosonate 8-phosphate phosphatase (KDO 8-P phosphatase)